MTHTRPIDITESNRVARRRANTSVKFVPQEGLTSKSIDSDYTKALRGISDLRFDPNAEDGDGDGLVQDNTPFERPAIIKPGLPASNVRGISPTGNFAFDRGRSWTRGKTSREIAEAVVPSTPAELVNAITMRLAATGMSNEQIDKALFNAQQFLSRATFDPQSIEATRRLVAETLDSKPRWRGMVDMYGISPYVVIDGPDGKISDDFASHNSLGFAAINKGFLLSDKKRSFRSKPSREAIKAAAKALEEDSRGRMSAKTMERALSDVSSDYLMATSGNPLQDALVHEWSHGFIQSVARMSPDESLRHGADLMTRSSWHEDVADPSNTKWAGRPVPDAVRDAYRYYNPGGMSDADRKSYVPKKDNNLPRVETHQAQMSPSEFMAEAISAHLSEDENVRSLLNPAAKELVETFIKEPSFTTGNTMNSLSPNEIASRVVPGSKDELMRLLSEHWRQLGTEFQKMYGSKKIEDIISRGLNDAMRSDSGIDNIDFSPEAVQRLRSLVEKSLIDNPDFYEAVQKFGMPPVFMNRTDVKYPEGRLTLAASMGYNFPAILMNAREIARETERGPRKNRRGIIATIRGNEGISGTTRAVVSYDMGSSLIHEWGHYVNKLAAFTHPDESIRKSAQAYWAESWLDLRGYTKNNSPLVRGLEELVQGISKGYTVDGNKVPYVLTHYGQTSPTEMFAEGIAALLSNDKRDRDLISPALRRDIEAIIGVNSAQSRDAVRRRRNGLRSASDVSEPEDKPSVPEPEDTPNIPEPEDTPEVLEPEDTPDVLEPERTPLLIRRDATTKARKFRSILSPTKGPDWLKDATREEIADAVVCQSVDDYIMFLAQSMMYSDPTISGDKVSAETAQQIAIELSIHVFGDMRNGIDAVTGLERTGITFSPESIARLQEDIIKAMEESPAFEYMVRRFGLPPMLPVDETAGLDLLQKNDSDPLNNPIMDILNKHTLGWSISNFGIVVNYAAENIRQRHPSGYLSGQSGSTMNRLRDISPDVQKLLIDAGVVDLDPRFNNEKVVEDSFVMNMGYSAADTIRHEWAHWFWSYAIGEGYVFFDTKAGRSLISAQSVPSSQSLADSIRTSWLLRATGKSQQEIDDLVEYLRETFHQKRKFFSSSHEDNIETAMRLGFVGIDRTTGVPFIDASHPDAPGQTTKDGTLLWQLVYESMKLTAGRAYGWNPKLAFVLGPILEKEYYAAIGGKRANQPIRTLPRIRGGYAGTNPQETWAELNALFMSPDAKLVSKYLTADILESVSKVFGFPLIRDENGEITGISLPFSEPGTDLPATIQLGPKRGLASRSATANITSSVPSRVHSGIDGAQRVRFSTPSVSITDTASGVVTFEHGGDTWDFITDTNIDNDWLFAYHSMANNPQRIRLASAAILGAGEKIDDLDRDSIIDAFTTISKIYDGQPSSEVSFSSSNAFSELLSSSKVGDEFLLLPTSFTPDASKSQERRNSSPNGIKILRLANGALVALPGKEFDGTYINSDGSTRRGPVEYVTAGTFRVNARHKLDNGSELIDISHVGVVDPRTRSVSGLASRSSRVVGEGSAVERVSGELSLTDEQRDILDKQVSKTHEAFSDGSIYEEPIHPAIDNRRKEIIDSIRIELSEDGIPMIIAEPNPILNSYLPKKRDWASIELPPREAVREFVKKLLGNQFDVPEGAFALGPDYRADGRRKLREYLESFVEDIRSKYEGIPVLPIRKYPGGDIQSYIDEYYNSLRDPLASTSLSPNDPYGDIHDSFGHFGTGRAFDRHGEWANFLAMKDIIESIPNRKDDPNGIGDDAREALLWSWFADFALGEFSTRGYIDADEVEAVEKALRTYDGDIMDLLNILDTGKNGLQSKSRTGLASRSKPTSGTKIKDVPVDELQAVSQQDAERRMRRQSMDGLASRSSRKDKRVRRRIVDSTAERGKLDTPRQAKTRQEILDRAFPTDPGQLREVLRSNPYTRRNKNKRNNERLLKDLNIDWDAQARMKKLFEEILIENPEFEKLLLETDIPPIFATKNGMTIGPFGDVRSSSIAWMMGEQGQYGVDTGFIAFNPGLFRADRDPNLQTYGGEPLHTPKHILRHEIGHAIHAMRNSSSDEAKEAYRRDTESMIRFLSDAAEELGQKIDDLDSVAARDILKFYGFNGAEDALLISNYAATNIEEYIAEAFAVLTANPSERVVELNDRHLQMLSDFLGIPMERIRRIYSGM